MATHTDGAIYNIDPTSIKVRRRITLANVGHLSTSLLQDNFFIIHVPSEYDYLFICSRKTEVVSMLTKAYSEATGEELNITMQNVSVPPSYITLTFKLTTHLTPCVQRVCVYKRVEALILY